MTVLNEIVFAERRVLVELGSGVSTVVIGRLLAERGGRLTSLEHDADWARVVRSQLAREELGGSVELVEAALEPHPESWEGAPWYSESAVAALPREIELLLIDGPPGYLEGTAHSRYPALPALTGHLAPGAIVILDDATRAAEGEIVERWRNELPAWEFGVDAEAGIAVGRRARKEPPA